MKGKNMINKIVNTYNSIKVKTILAIGGAEDGINDEFNFGDNILVSPVVEQGARHKLVYLPESDNWIDYWTGEEYKGGQYIIKEAPLDICPIFIKSLSLSNSVHSPSQLKYIFILAPPI